MCSKPFLWILGIGFSFIAILSGCNKETTESVPKVYADSSRTITLPVDSVTLSGSATNTDGGVKGWLWSEVSGPNVPVIEDEGSPSTTITGLTTGMYIFQLMVVDSNGATGVGEVTITVNSPSSLVLRTFFSWGRFETHFQGNATQDYTDTTAPELDAATWTVQGSTMDARGAFVFNMGSMPANVPVKSALLSLYSNHSPINGNMVDANYGSTNAFYISRIGNAWNHSTTFWANQPVLDSTGEVLIPQTNQSFLDVTNVDVTTMVNNMISSGNYGFEIRLQTEQIYNSRIFYSSIGSDSTKWPKLVVSY